MTPDVPAGRRLRRTPFGEDYNSVLVHLHERALLGMLPFTVFTAPLAWLICLLFLQF